MTSAQRAIKTDYNVKLENRFNNKTPGRLGIICSCIPISFADTTIYREMMSYLFLDCVFQFNTTGFEALCLKKRRALQSK